MLILKKSKVYFQQNPWREKVHQNIFVLWISDLSQGQRLSRRSRGRGCHPGAPRRCWPGCRRRGSRGWRRAREAARSLRTDSDRTWPTPGSGAAGWACWGHPSPDNMITHEAGEWWSVHKGNEASIIMWICHDHWLCQCGLFYIYFSLEGKLFVCCLHYNVAEPSDEGKK